MKTKPFHKTLSVQAQLSGKCGSWGSETIPWWLFLRCAHQITLTLDIAEGFMFLREQLLAFEMHSLLPAVFIFFHLLQHSGIFEKKLRISLKE